MSSISKEKHPTQTKMNSTNLYVTTTQIILRSDPNNPGSWQDLYRLVPYLRNSLCCVVCSNLLVEPHSPVNAQCQHHVCKRCKGGRKRLKPACENCKDCQDYGENKSLRILMQMYKKMCLTIMNSPIFLCIKSQACQPGTGFERGASNLIQLIREGAQFEDDYKSQGGLPKSTYSILPCIYTKSACPQNIPALQNLGETSKNLPCSQNRSLYSVVYPGSGNKITIKRKPKDSTNCNTTNNALVNSISSCKPKEISEKGIFKKPCMKAKKGCRCGNATATPGKLTCCGQRCPCYVESKACIDCKCRGCRNPHRPDGNKVMPYLQELDSSQMVMSSISEMRLQHLQLLPTSSSQQHSQHLLDDTMQPVKLEGLQLETQFFTTDAMNQQYKAYKLLGSSFDPIQSLTTSDLITYGLSEEEEDDTEITVV
ncbi:E3 ubiquitin-protein ligase MSL2 [Cylas formicarius]|uniref:E3 ubiquitin-protein ligase MSL2 n=1 Tax=Cylas formicarius TaxID=197179 RepID=UPI002958A2F4|nr:E3 ubiquitin-protein ligase MSL2 [Cylas formicarius]